MNTDFWLSGSVHRGYSEDDVTLVTGGTGMVGKHLMQYMPDAVMISHGKYDLRNEADVKSMFQHYKPTRVIHLAARVGGLLDNMIRGSDYLEDNVMMNTLIVKYARIAGVKKCILVGSSCIYPAEVSSYPMTMEDLLKGPPPQGNRGYAYAKRLMTVHMEECNRQHGTKFQCVYPCNLYGPYDNFNPKSSHMIAATVRKVHEAKEELVMLGDGTPQRQFMYADDLAWALRTLVKNDEDYNSYNIAPPDSNRTIKEYAEAVVKASGKDLAITFDGEVQFNGQPRKDIDASAFYKAYPDMKFTSLEDGLKKTVDGYANQRHH